MWSPLLEKAYAKWEKNEFSHFEEKIFDVENRLCGSYEAMEGGFTTDALIDMTGGIEEAFELNSTATAGSKEFQEQIKTVLRQAYYRQSMIGCSITVRRFAFWTNENKKKFNVFFSFSQADPKITEARLDNGLVKGFRIDFLSCGFFCWIFWF